MKKKTNIKIRDFRKLLIKLMNKEKCYQRFIRLNRKGMKLSKLRIFSLKIKVKKNKKKRNQRVPKTKEKLEAQLIYQNTLPSRMMSPLKKQMTMNR